MYELDHWCTSYREAMDYVNRTAPKEVTVAVWGPVAAAADFARKDLAVLPDDGTRTKTMSWAASGLWMIPYLYQDMRLCLKFSVT